MAYKKTPIYDKDGKYDLERLRSWKRGELEILKVFVENDRPMTVREVFEIIRKKHETT